jgi:hypothetical protein
MCTEEDRCTYNVDHPPTPLGFWALAATNKLIRGEMQELFLKKPVISVQERDLYTWLDYVSGMSPGKLENVRRLTIAGSGAALLSTLKWTIARIVSEGLPNLESVGFQCQDSVSKWIQAGESVATFIQRIREKGQWLGTVMPLRHIDPKITVTLEAMIWRQGLTHDHTSERCQQFVMRYIREGKTIADSSASNPTNGGVKIQVIMSDSLASRKDGAKWRKWWKTKDRGRWG